MDTCQEWSGFKDRDGYGRTRDHRKAHRAAWEAAYGAIPDGLTVDHLCFNPGCVNPEHLRLLTADENRRNQRSATKATCDSGHEFTPENTYYRTPSCSGARQCRACNREAVRRYKSRRAAA